VEIVKTARLVPLGRDSIQTYLRQYWWLAFSHDLVVYYRLPGLIADLALLIYALLTWASFGRHFDPPGVAGLSQHWHGC